MGATREVRLVRPRTYRVLILVHRLTHGPVTLALTHGTYEPRVVDSVAAARAELARWDPDLLVVQIGPDHADAAALVGWTQAGRRVPTIAITTHGDSRTKIEAFARGADDVLNIPFLPEELVARAMAVMRRTYAEGIELISAVRLGAFEIDLLQRSVRIGDGRQVPLTPLEHGLLWLLVGNAGTPLSRRFIEESLWGSALGTSSNVVEQHVRRLRLKLGDSARRPKLIETISGRGYRFVGRLSELTAQAAPS